jgi:hypothetical protein
MNVFSSNVRFLFHRWLILNIYLFIYFIVYFLPSSLPLLIKNDVISTFHAAICVLSVMKFFARYSINLKEINRIAEGRICRTGDEIMISMNIRTKLSSATV